MKCASQAIVWREAVAAEIASASALLDSATVLVLTRSYDALGLQDDALNLINRVSRFGVDNRDLLPLMIDSLVRRRELAKLTQALRLVVQLKERPVPLRRQVVRAMTLLGQAAPAAQEWCALLEAHSAVLDLADVSGTDTSQGAYALDGSDWLELARFVAAHGNVGDLGKTLEGMQGSFCGYDFEPLAMFCLLRTQLDQERQKAHTTLEQLSPTGFDDPECAFELGLAAFRLGDYRFAAAAGAHAVRLKPQWPVALSALTTFEAFLSGPPDRNPRSGTGRLGKRIRLQAGSEEAALAACASVPGHEYAWGVMRVHGEDRPVTRLLPFGPSDERALDLPDDGTAIATFSVLPKVEPDPLEVLPFVDWSIPHLMLQRSESRSICHVFAGASGHREWYWEPVRLDSGQEPCVVATGDTRVCLWRDVLAELEVREREEEF